MKLWLSFLDWLTARLTRRFFDVLSKKDEKIGVKLCLRIVRGYMFFRPQLKKAALRNLQIVFPQYSLQEREKLATSSYRILAENLFWFSRIRKFSREEMRALFDYREAEPIYNKILTYPVGALIITPHFGLFELLAQGYAVCGRPFMALVREFGMPELDTFWRDTRQKFGMTIFGRKGGYNEVVRNINAGHDVAVLFDQNVKRAHAAFVELFGIPAATTKSIALAAIRTNCPIVFAACIENPPEEAKHGRFKIYARELINPNLDPDLKDKPIEEKVIGFLLKANKELESLIQIKPDAWFWIHRRWKTRPESEAENFYN